MNNSQNQRVIVITGATAGLGRATAQAFARSEGARIGLIARGQDGLEGTRRDVESLGGQALIIQADVADADAIDPIEVWGNNALDAGEDQAIDGFGIWPLASIE